jgi:hypothetical protein
VRKRQLLVAVAALGLAVGCGGAATGTSTAPPPEPPPPDVKVAAVTDLLTVADLEWLVLLRPEAIVSVTWLDAPLGKILRDERLDLLARATSIDLRKVPELVLASYRGKQRDDDVVAYFVRHRAAQRDVEVKFRERLTSDATRIVAGHQLVTIFGMVGRSPHGLAAIGPDVAGFQYGGTRNAGPARIAMLYAQGKLARVPTVLADPTLARLHAALHAPLAEVLLPGPFEGELGRGARGLLAAADGVGIALATTERQTLALDVLLAGDYAATPAEGERAIAFLTAAWNDLGASDLGHLLGLDKPVSGPVASLVDGGMRLSVELDATALLDGLAAATVENVREIMRD